MGFSISKRNKEYLPNQFFDVVLRCSSRPCVRIVAYFFSKTLGLRDRSADPMDARVHISHRDLAKNAGVSRSTIKDALLEAINSRYIKCLRPGLSNRSGIKRTIGVYEIVWDETSDYTTDKNKFQGFYGRNFANRTNAPVEFLDVVVKTEPLSVIKVVAVVIRNTIGYRTEEGSRRQTVKMSFSQIRRSTRLSNQPLLDAIQTAIKKRYIKRLKVGVFDKTGGLESKAATYAMYWANSPSGCTKNIAIRKGRPKNLRNGPETRVEERPEKLINKKRTEIRNNCNKQQICVVDEDIRGSYNLLLAQGIAPATAKRLSREFSKEEIKNQCAWIDLRTITKNRTGLLIRAIETKMSKPETSNPVLKDAKEFASHFYAELGGNKGRPVAPPSAKDLECAGRFLSELCSISPDRSIPEFARKFGRFVKRHQSRDAWPISSFVLALRYHGEDFISKIRKQAHIDEYYSYLHGLEAQIREKRPDIYREFLENVYRHNDSSNNIGTFKSKRRDAYEFLSYFKNYSVYPVMNFDEWKRDRIQKQRHSKSE